MYQPDVVVFPAPPADDVASEDLPVPLLVVEVLSASTGARDRAVKRLRYLEAGVREVWLIDRENRTIDVHDAATARKPSPRRCSRASSSRHATSSPESLFA